MSAALSAEAGAEGRRRRRLLPPPTFVFSLSPPFAGEEVAKCPSCSLYVRVIYDPEDFQQPAGEEQPVA